MSRAQQQLRRLLRVVVALRGGRARAKVVVEDLLGGGGGGGGMPNGYYGYVALEGWCGSTVTTFTLRSSGGGACNVDLTLQISILRSDAPSTLPSHTRHTLVTNSSHTRRTLVAHASDCLVISTRPPPARPTSAAGKVKAIARSASPRSNHTSRAHDDGYFFHLPGDSGVVDARRREILRRWGDPEVVPH